MKKTSDLTRREVLAGALAGPALAQGTGKRPNILFAISDDQSFLHTSAEGYKAISTPHFDRVAKAGVRFTHSYCSSPSCTPSRGAVLTGQHFWRLEEGGNLWSSLPKKFSLYTDLLEEAGYHVGLQGKGWGPGDIKAAGRTRNPAGKDYKSFDAFLAARPQNAPFCFWFGSVDPHRPYDEGSGVKAGIKLEDVVVPPWLPDAPEVRSDIADYLLEIQRFDRELGAMLAAIEKAGELANTLVVVTSDNGMPFPAAKTNLYDSGTRMPLAISWPARVRGGRVVEEFVSHTDFAPTFLEAAGLPVPEGVTGRSLLPVLEGKGKAADRVFTGRERHTKMRPGGVGYPMRAVRTKDFLYIRNYEPDRWPASDPPHYGDIDNGPSKEFVITHANQPQYAKYFQMACAKRPAEELYDLRRDPVQQNNVAGELSYKKDKERMAAMLRDEQVRTGDPRGTGAPVIWDSSPYYGQVNSVLRK